MMKQIVGLSTLLLFFACQPVNHHAKGDRTENKLDQLTWMLGKWQMTTPEGVITEEWAHPYDTQWHGISYMVTVAGDTSFHERIHLNFRNDTLYYLPVVSDQNEGKEVIFTEKSLTDDEVVFENLYHDFPQRIIYRRTSDTSILAAIEGNKDGQLKREQFTYTKTD